MILRHRRICLPLCVGLLFALLSLGAREAAGLPQFEEERIPLPAGLAAPAPTAQPRAQSRATEVVSLPLVASSLETGAAAAVAAEPAQATPLPTATPTLVPLPPQTVSASFPIVVGASVIVAIILIAWVAFGRRPKRS